MNGVYFLVPRFFVVAAAATDAPVFAFLCLVASVSLVLLMEFMSTRSRLRFRILPSVRFPATSDSRVTLLLGGVYVEFEFSGSTELSVGGVALAGNAVCAVPFVAAWAGVFVVLAFGPCFLEPGCLGCFARAVAAFFAVDDGFGAGGDNSWGLEPFLVIAREPLPAPAASPPAAATVGLLLLATEHSAPPSEASAAALVFDRDDRVLTACWPATAAAAFFLGGIAALGLSSCAVLYAARGLGK